MKKNVDRKIIESAIQAELKKELIVEFGGKMFDAPARAVAGIGNAFSNIGGQMKLGAVNKELSRVAKRIDDDWKSAEDVVTKLANKMSTSKNPNIKQKAQAVQQNLRSVSGNLKNASNQLKSMASIGADSPGVAGGPLDSKLGMQKITDKYGFSKNQSAVDRWIENFGGDMGRMSKPEQGKLQKMFFDLLSAGIDPFEVPKDKQEMLRQYHNFRMAEIAETGNDPFANYEHFEKVLGPQVADKARKADAGLQANEEKKKLQSKLGDGPADQTRFGGEMSPKAEPVRPEPMSKEKEAEWNKQLKSKTSPLGKYNLQAQAGAPRAQKLIALAKEKFKEVDSVDEALKAANDEVIQQINNKAAAPKQNPPEQNVTPPNVQNAQPVEDEYTKLAANLSPNLKSDLSKLLKQAKQAGVKQSMLGKYLISQLPGPNKFMDTNDQAFLSKLKSKFGEQEQQAPVNSFGGGDFDAQPEPEKPNWQTKAYTPPQQQQKNINLPPVASKSAKKVLPPNQSVQSFFDLEEKQPQQIPSAIEKPPVQDFGNEIQYGSAESPAMMPRNLMLPQMLQKKSPKKKTKNS